MEILNIKEYDLDWIMENYFNTDKEVMFMCDFKTAWEILKYGEYEDEDFEDYFSVDMSCEYPYYSVYKDSNNTFIIELLTKLDGELYSEYQADNILIQGCVLDEYDKNIITRCNSYKFLIELGDVNNINNEELENTYSTEQCDCCKCCDECCEEEKDEVLDQIYQQGVKDTLKAIGELFNIEIEMN